MLILFLIAISACFKPLQKSTTPIIQLDSANFQSKTHIRLYKCCPHDSHPLQYSWLIIFKDKSQTPMTKLEALAKGYHTKEELRIASVDCVKNKALCDKAQVSTYPTIIYFTKEGHAYKYDDTMQLEEFIQNGFKNQSPLKFQEIGMLQDLVQNINSLSLGGLALFALSVATFLHSCFSQIFKERPSKLKQHRE